jgi:hypothetical protein
MSYPLTRRLCILGSRKGAELLCTIPGNRVDRNYFQA